MLVDVHCFLKYQLFPPSLFITKQIHFLAFLYDCLWHLLFVIFAFFTKHFSFQKHLNDLFLLLSSSSSFLSLPLCMELKMFYFDYCFDQKTFFWKKDYRNNVYVRPLLPMCICAFLKIIHLMIFVFCTTSCIVFVCIVFHNCCYSELQQMYFPSRAQQCI